MMQGFHLISAFTLAIAITTIMISSTLIAIAITSVILRLLYCYHVYYDDCY